jgi:DNA-binding transcriptional MocR family regulator
VRKAIPWVPGSRFARPGRTQNSQLDELMHFPRMPIEAESPEQFGYDKIRFNLTESSVRDRTLGDIGLDDLGGLTLAYTDHLGHAGLRALVAARAGGGLGAENVLVTAGAAAALFIIAISLL